MTSHAALRGAGVALAFVAPPYVIFVHPTLELVRRNGEYFSGYTAGWQLYLAAFEFLLGGVVLWFLRSTAVSRLALSAYLLSGVGWFAYSTAGQALEPRGALLALLGVVLVVGAVRMHPRLEDTVETLGIVGAILVVGLASSPWFAPSSVEAAAETADRQRAGDDRDPGISGGGQDRSDLPNVYHLVLDEFQTEMFELALTTEVERKLDGFLFFPEASTPFGRTEMAMASTFASRSYAYDEPLGAYIDGAYTDGRSLLGVLRRAGYDTAGWLHSRKTFGGRSPFDQTYLHRDVAGDPGAHADQASLLRSIWVHTQLPPSLSSRVIPPHHFDQLEGDVLLPDDAPPVSVTSFRTFLRSEHRLPARGRYVLAHLILPHFPNLLDENCTYREGIRTSVVEQTGCALLLIEEFVDRLRSLDRYEQSLIVIQGDHGSRYELHDDELVQIGPDYFGERWSRARSRPLLLVKPPGARHEGIRVSSFAATLEDVLPTVADALGLSAAQGDGRVSLLADRLPERPRRYYHFYAKDPRAVIAGDLHRFVITAEGIAFDRAIPVPPR